MTNFTDPALSLTKALPAFPFPLEVIPQLQRGKKTGFYALGVANTTALAQHSSWEPLSVRVHWITHLLAVHSDFRQLCIFHFSPF